MPDVNPHIPGINLPQGFHLNQIKAIPLDRLRIPLDFPPSLGALAHFTGTFGGRGFNLIFRPQNAASMTPLPNNPAHGNPDNILELNLTQETLSFSKPLGSVPNRGSAQGDMFLNGVPYVQSIEDITDGPAVPIHFEPGIWLAVPETKAPKEPATFVRIASIPHGTTINLQGSATGPVAGPPNIPAIDPTPFQINNPHNKIPFPSQIATDPLTFRIPQDLTTHIASQTITQNILNDPNTVLRNAIAGQRVVETVTIEVASSPEIPAGALHIPSEGGGTDNIAFLAGNGAPNGDVPKIQGGPGGRTMAGVKSTFWIETVEHEIHVPVFIPGHGPITVAGQPNPFPGIPSPIFTLNPTVAIKKPTTIRVRSIQIQYSQIVLLNFNGLSWPHVSVATLVQTSPITPPATVWK